MIRLLASPDHPGGGVAHAGVLGLDEFLVVVDSAVDFIILFTRQLLSGEILNINNRNKMKNKPV